MRVYLNFTPRRGPYGGANSFLRTLMGELGRHGVAFTSDARAQVDVAFVNALTDRMTLQQVIELADRGVPIVHRKTGYRGRGTREMREEIDGVITGDRLQIEFTPYVAHTIFQSTYSKEVFRAAGFAGPSTVVPNGVDSTIFNTTLTRRLRSPRPRSYWANGEPLRVLISTWSTDDSKGFPRYRQIDAAIRERSDLVLTLVGRVPEGTRFDAIRVVRPRPATKLAALLKRQHVLLHLTEHESCSNALIEGINCGLPAIYLDSGANHEVGHDYGVPWRSTLDEALERLLPDYRRTVAAIPENPFRISIVGLRYLEILRAVAEHRHVPV